MIYPKPAMFYKITPINPNGITIVDLGETDDIPPLLVARRHSSLPPVVETRTTQVSRGEYNRKGRHSSLPPKAVTIVSPSPSFEASIVSETDEKEDNMSIVSCLLLTSTAIVLTAS